MLRFGKFEIFYGNFFLSDVYLKFFKYTPNLHSFVLNESLSLTDEVLKDLETYLSNLLSLELKYCHLVTNILKGLTSLSRLGLISCNQVTDKTIKKISNNLTQLKSLFVQTKFREKLRILEY